MGHLDLMPNLGKVFYHLSHAPAEVANDYMDEIERFFVVLYKRTSSLKKVNEARKQLFAHGNRKVENIPPTKEALCQHVKSLSSWLHLGTVPNCHPRDSYTCRLGLGEMSRQWLVSISDSDARGNKRV